MAKIANVALTNTFNTWRTNSNIGFDRLSQFAINNSALYANTITANVAFTSSGLATLSGRATVGTNLTVSGNTTLGAAGKRITSTGVITHTGNITVSGNTSTNKATVTSSLTVSGNTTLGAAGKIITSTGVIAHTGNITVSGNTSTNKATVTSLFTSSGNTNINNSSANGVFANTAGVGFFSNSINFTSKKIRNFTEDLMSYRASSTAITLTTQRNAQRISLTGNATVTLPTGMPGSTEAIKSLVIIFKQDATGGRTMAFAAPAGESLLYNNSATLPPVSTGANKVTIYVCTKFDGDTRWYIALSFIEV